MNPCRRIRTTESLLASAALVVLVGACAVAIAHSGRAFAHGLAAEPRPTGLAGGEDLQAAPPGPSLAAEATGGPLTIQVRGNRLLDGRRHKVQLVGIDRSGTQYMCVLGKGIFDGPTDRASIQAIKSWGVNSVRLPLNEDCWLGINGVDPAYSGHAYRSAIESYVGELNRAGLYVILDVHWSAPGQLLAEGQQPMLDASHGYAVWRSIARAFRFDRGVLFDLYNEPHDLGSTPTLQWECWLAGCGGYAGMGPLVRSIREVGARNVILLGGLDWASDDSAWLQYEPRDPTGQLAAAFHVYRGHTHCTDEPCWDQTLLPVARHVPIVADEFGEMQCGEPSALTWLGSWMSYATTHGFGILAWSWNVKAGPCGSTPLLITAYDGTPTEYGAAVRAFFLGPR